ncbi:MAG: family 2 glycosyl transferase [Lentisphaerae bacterium GWF2_52_8]|nr:MAG: family 2 glycosyl transferase [Lentisphaerae bacterium GWF2_52_8]
MKLSAIIPAHNEEGCLEETVSGLHRTLESAGISHEILIVNDHSSDSTGEIGKRLELKYPGILRCVDNGMPCGFGFAVRTGLSLFEGDAVSLFMADNSDSPDDLVKFFRKLEEGFDCVFGSRFGKGGKTIDYPPLKLMLNRLANPFIRTLFMIGYNDITNAFKLYRRETIEGLKPFLSHHFNITVELPLKAIIRGYSYAVIPNSWTNRKSGVSKLRIKEMGSRYLFIVLYCFIEKLLSVGDYRKH